MTLEIIGAASAVGVAMGLYDFERRHRNALLSGAAASAVALVAGVAANDHLRLAIFVPVYFVLGAVGTYFGYLIKHRLKR